MVAAPQASSALRGGMHRIPPDRRDRAERNRLPSPPRLVAARVPLFRRHRPRLQVAPPEFGCGEIPDQAGFVTAGLPVRYEKILIALHLAPPRAPQRKTSAPAGHFL